MQDQQRLEIWQDHKAKVCVGMWPLRLSVASVTEANEMTNGEEAQSVSAHLEESTEYCCDALHVAEVSYPRGDPPLRRSIDILKLVAAQVGSQWKDIYQFLCNASEREVAAFSSGYTADHERAYAALQHWTIRGPEASLAQLISALRQHRRNDVVEKIRGLMEDTTQVMEP
ncbi:hypothetical protein P7K49_008079 [Saguinus oedipus]|uniref:Death domain-containing protein n=1 Tax=Saguinus oedipus TaxID=9490 RepID=A0ABQ9VZ30_SAGOE|nr:hypothetical protein P7K49_008079 [Saguinus oedipus]